MGVGSATAASLNRLFAKLTKGVCSALSISSDGEAGAVDEQVGLQRVAFLSRLDGADVAAHRQRRMRHVARHVRTPRSTAFRCRNCAEQCGVEVVAVPDVEREAAPRASGARPAAPGGLAMKKRSGCACTSAPFSRARRCARTASWSGCPASTRTGGSSSRSPGCVDQPSNVMPHLYVALHARHPLGFLDAQASKNPRSHGVEPSPTPMMPTTGDSSDRDLHASIQQGSCESQRRHPAGGASSHDNDAAHVAWRGRQVSVALRDTVRIVK